MNNFANIMRNCAIAIILLILSPINAFSAEEKPVPVAKNSPPKVVATIKPVYSLVSAVMGELGQPELLIDAKASEHDYSLKPSDAKKLQNADIVFFISMDLETFLIKTISSLPDGSMAVELAGSEGVTRQQPLGWLDENERKSYDPHIWLSPENSIAMVKQIKKILSLKDPKNRGIYEMNAKKYINRISSTSEKITLKLSPYKNVPFISMHDAYGYFVKFYGLNQAAAVALNPEISLSAEKVKDVNNTIKSRHVYCIFADPAFNEAQLRKILNNPDRVKIGTLDSIGTDAPKAEDIYINTLEGISNNLLSCLGGDGNI